MNFKLDNFYKGEVIVFNILPYVNIGKTNLCKFLNIGWLFWNFQIKL